MQANPTMAPAQLFVVTYLDWEREGESPFEVQRAQLLDQLTSLTAALQSQQRPHAPAYLLLGGQSIILSDVAEIHPNLLTLLVILNASGKLGLGPWYVQTEPMLVGGESLVRNLLVARADANRHNVKLMTAAYVQNGTLFPAQLPQILRGFGLHTLLLHVHDPHIRVPFVWRAADGSDVLAIPYEPQAEPGAAQEQQQHTQPDGPYLWLDAAPLQQRNGSSAPDIAVHKPGALDAYLQALRKTLPDDYRPRLTGELRLHNTALPDGPFSTRLPLKQAHRQLEARLTYVAERLLALALTHGQVTHPDTQRVLLDHVWRLLLQNQARSTLSGAVGDLVQAHASLRNQQITDVSEYIVRTALNALPGRPFVTAPDPEATTYVMVWNPHGFTCEQVVDCGLHLPEGYNPLALRNPDHEPIPFTWDEGTTAYSGRLLFRAEVPALGYAVYTLRLGKESTPEQYLKHISEGRRIANPAGETLAVEGGNLVWSRSGRTISNLLSYYDGGDNGDARAYRAPIQDHVVPAMMTDMIKTISTAVYERLMFRQRMRVAPELTDGVRRRGLRLLDITTIATFYDTLPGIHFRTHFNNTANDHRLRAHIRTHISAEDVWVDAPFAVGRRRIAEHAGRTQAMHSFVALQRANASPDDPDGNGAMALFTRGLPEFEASSHPADEQVTLALTLLRAVGWLDQARGVRAPGAQLHRDGTVEFMLQPAAKLDPAALWRTSQAYQVPLQAFQYDAAPDGETLRSYLTIADERIILTALKPPLNAEGWTVRLLNPTPEMIITTLIPEGTLAGAERLNLAEEMQSELDVRQNRVTVRLDPQQILTVRLRFEGM